MRTIYFIACLLVATYVWGEDPRNEYATVEGTPGERYFGFAVSLVDDLAVAGTPIVDDDSPVYVFRRVDDEEWVEEDRLLSGYLGDFMGFSVDTSGEFIVAGAPFYDEGPTLPQSGCAYVFVWDQDDEEWVEEQRLVASTELFGAEFGRAVATDGERILISGPLGFDGGNAYVFSWDDTEEEWAEQQILQGSRVSIGDWFGSALDIDGDIAVVASSLELVGSAAYSGSGRVHVFRWSEDDEEWSEEQVLESESDADDFGYQVAVSGNFVAVGADRDDEEGEDAGAVYIFSWDEDEEEWMEDAVLVASDSEEFAEFGRSLSMDQNRILVGAPEANDSEGAGYVFWRTTAGDWVETLKLTASEAETDWRVASATSIHGETALARSFEYDDTDELVPVVAFFDVTPELFLRGDVDSNNVVSGLVDSLFLLEWQFSDGDEPGCMDAADVDDNGTVSPLLDSLALLQWAFLDEEPPVYPGTEECGVDPRDVEDVTGCETPQDDCR